ncbi:hypothetical protein OBBRIDRAFT_171562 [Obba rivulosa]|uniref:Uncharacterized protein n=1 Tax=Obba rivulosa TaxID=1052685 RepID=A0A8E2AV55_9APHY|nr:hypothetical protein OBBRIDRAFT_171562 [Obba rivulosa]
MPVVNLAKNSFTATRTRDAWRCWAWRIFLWSDYYSEYCDDSCEHVFLEMRTRFEHDTDFIASGEPLDTWTYIINDFEQSLCTTCWERLVERERLERVRIWESLPSYFNVDVPNWPKTVDLPNVP